MKKLMKKYIAAVLTLCFLLFAPFLAPLVAYADALVEPNNSFYGRHQSDFVYLGRSFVANGAGGFAAVKTQPGASRDIAKLQNGETTYLGETVYLLYSCLYDGDYWGFSLLHNGWIKIDELLVLYDYISFEEEFFDSFYTYTGDYAAIKEIRSAIVWAWPGSGAQLWTYEDLNMESFGVSHAYMDDQGREWGFIAYLYGARNIWVCLSDPLSDDIPAFHPAPEPMPWQSDTVHTEIKAEREDSAVLIIVVLVAAVVIATAALIVILYKPCDGKVTGKGLKWKMKN